VGQAADAATMLTAALFVALVVSWLADAASRSDALELDHRGPSRPQLSRSVPCRSACCPPSLPSS
jgi:hypothetical protein